MYRKVQVKIWADRKFLNFSPQAKLLFFYLLTGRHSCQIPGVIVGGKEEICAAIMGVKAFVEGFDEGLEKAFQEVFAEGCLKASPKVGLMYLPRGVHHNKPQSPNVVKAWGKAWGEIPECNLKNEIFRDLKAFMKGLGKAYDKAFAEGFGEGFAEGFAEAETETEVINNNMQLRKSSVQRSKKQRRKKHELDLARAMSIPIMEHLSGKTGKRWEPKKYSIDLICDLVHEQITLKQILTVIDYCCETWTGDIRRNLKPKTLLNALQFDKRLDEAQAFYSTTQKEKLQELKGV